jgi:hypothetical protein
MIEKAENKAFGSAPRSKSEERRLAVQNEAREGAREFYFSAEGVRPPTTIIADSFEEAVAEYNRRFDISTP